MYINAFIRQLNVFIYNLSVDLLLAIECECLGMVAIWGSKAQQLELPADDIKRMVLAFQVSGQG